MAMTQNQLRVIKAIAKNDMPAARKAARSALGEDQSKKNAFEVNQLKQMLDPAINPDLTKLPYQVEGLLEVEHPKESFIPARFHVSPAEAELFDDISTMRTVCDELSRLRIRRSNSVLLHGKSGTGKTTFARYIASTYDLPFYNINFSNLIDSHLGSTAKNVAKVFDYVRCEPCVLMLDEIDTIAQRRTRQTGVDGEINRITVTIMQEFDRLNNNQIVIGATNRLDVIDEALIRRFSRVHEVKPPEDAYEAAAVVRAVLDDTGMAYDDGDLIVFCDKHVGKPQAWFVGKAIEHIIRTIEERISNEGGFDER